MTLLREKACGYFVGILHRAQWSTRRPKLGYHRSHLYPGPQAAGCAAKAKGGYDLKDCGKIVWKQ
jgi:hypothetical protein